MHHYYKSAILNMSMLAIAKNIAKRINAGWRDSASALRETEQEVSVSDMISQDVQMSGPESRVKKGEIG